MSLGQYANYSADQKLTILLTKVDSIEGRIESLEKKYDDKPCPSENCLACQSDTQDLKRAVVRIEAVQEDHDRKIEDLVKFKDRTETTCKVEGEAVQEKKTRESWVIPMWAMIALTVLTFVKDLFL